MPRSCLKNTAFRVQNQGMCFLFECIFVASFLFAFLISQDFLHLCHGEMAPFVQIGESGGMMCCAMMFAAGRQNDVFAGAKMMQPPTAAMQGCRGTHLPFGFMRPQGVHHWFRRNHIILPQGRHHAAKRPLSRRTGAFAVHHSYSFPHCLPVKKRSVVVARNTLPARSTVVGNSGCEGLHG